MANELLLANILSPDFDVTTITKAKVNPPNNDKEKLAFILKNVLSDRECEALINFSEKLQYSRALLNIGGGKEILHTDIRKSSRVIFDDEEFVSILWSRISAHIPKTFKGHKVVGINERLRFLRYDSGDYFKPHYDGSYERPDGSQLSLITLQIYLNDGFSGGETTFLSSTSGDKLGVVPETGMILVFEHRLLHEGSLLIEGRKYTIRTDVMYNYKM